MSVLIRVNSHRARRKLFAAIGEPPAFYSFARACTGGFYRIAPGDLPAALAITGISRARDGDDMLKCWTWAR